MAQGTRQRIAAVFSVAMALCLGVAAAPEWRDASPHTVRLVEVEPDVRLEVLDWGGSGRALVLLAGSGNTAHVFDDFAPKLTDCCHVYGITRRGFGGSSQPASGYDDQRRADDVLRVLEALHLDRPVVAGHSMAGDELTTLGHQRSDRLGGLVYLDALGDPRDFPSADPAYIELAKKLPPGSPPCPLDRSSFTALRASLACSSHVTFPESELRNTWIANADGTVGRFKTPQSITQAIGNGQKKRDYSNIRVPVLVMFEFPRTSLDQLRPDEPQPRNAEERQAQLAFWLATKTFVDRWTDNLKKSVPGARVVDLPAAGHYVFLTREADVLSEMHKFVRTLN
jgi:pimeloyl-ACP methyl ester carboxylesterase